MDSLVAQDGRQMTNDSSIYSATFYNYQYLHLSFSLPRDGRLQEGDQLLAINGQALEVSHQEAIRILQSAHGTAEIVVARGGTALQPEHQPRYHDFHHLQQQQQEEEEEEQFKEEREEEDGDEEEGEEEEEDRLSSPAVSPRSPRSLESVEPLIQVSVLPRKLNSPFSRAPLHCNNIKVPS